MSRTRMYVVLAILVALVAFFLVRLHSAGGAVVDNVSEGHRLAEAWCKPCHAIEPHHLATPLDPAPSFDAIANRRGTTMLSLKVFLKTSHQNMPNLVIKPDQADALASYILSLESAN
jgi:cytochrome c